jgi:hypothetical protein
MLAHYLSSIPFPMADIIIDLHSGGRSANFLPCAHMHLVPDLKQRQSMILATEAFLTDYTFLYTDVAGSGLLPSEAERQGKIVITTELGGGEPVLAGIHCICQPWIAERADSLQGAAGTGADSRRARTAASAVGASARWGRLLVEPVLVPAAVHNERGASSTWLCRTWQRR